MAEMPKKNHVRVGLYIPGEARKEIRQRALSLDVSMGEYLAMLSEIDRDQKLYEANVVGNLYVGRIRE